MIAVVVIFLIVLGLVHMALYESLTGMFGIADPHILLVLKAVFAILAISYICAAFLSAKWSNVFVRAVYKTASVWLGLMVYACIASTLYVFLSLFSAYVSPVGNADSIGQILVYIGLLLSFYGFIHSSRIRTTTVVLEVPALPLTWRGRKAVLVSDLHLGQVRGRKFLEKVVRKILALNPDAVFIAGDLYDGVKVDERAIIEPLKQLKPAYGVFFVSGNHEEFQDSTHFMHAVRDTGITVLDNKAVDVMGLQIVGVNDKDSVFPDRFREILSGLNIESHRASILLKHRPDLLSMAEQSGISVQLSGHTHRAQIWPFRFLARLVYKGYDYGLRNFGRMQVYVSSGAGTWGPPMRVGTDAEIVEITFR